MSLPLEKKMDPINSYLGRELLEEITPVVMVLSTPLAEDACRKNGLSFVDTLRPFSLFRRIDVPVRTANDQPYRLQMFKLRLVYASDIRQRNHEDAEERLKQVVSDASETMLSDLRSDPPQLETVLSKPESDFLPSWIRAFNKELKRTVSFSEHEAFDHPVACLLVVSSKDDQPINKFVDLFNTDQLPSLLNEGVMDPKILKHYLLLHDNQHDTPEKAASILAEMRSTFGSNDCKLLHINSAQGKDDKLKDNPWTHYRIQPSISQDIACHLNTDDLGGIKDFMQDLSSKHIIPHMEQKIRILNQQVSATRKGFRNQIKNLWWRRKEDVPETPNGPMYTFSSAESQIRVLGDYAFMLRDYELALSNYRLLSTDYKLDKAWKRYAGIQEMMGLSFFMLDQSRKESEYCMETAFTTYLKMGAAQRNATRCGLWWVDMLKARGQHKDAASVYFRISNEELTLHAAVMLEQASYCYLLSKPPMLRKYAFHLVLAGCRYHISNQKQHALRMYRSALSVYKGHAWNYISDHVHFNLGRWYAFLGMSDVAIKHMLEVLACSQQSLTTQDLFLTDFFRAVEKMGMTFEVNKLPLPVINMSSYKVIYEDHRTYASSADVSVNESLWQSLEEEMVPSTSTVRSNWLESQSMFSPSKKYNDSRVCAVGEAIKLDLEFRNPLQISISISGICLICELSASSEAAKSDEIGHQDDEEPRELPSCRNLNNDGSSLTSPEFDLVLRGGESKRVQMEVTPKVEGILKIIGVRWKLSGLVGGYHHFEFEKKKKQRRGKRGPKQPLTSNLDFIVIKGLPKLEGCIKDLPRKAYAGDLWLCMLELRNQSEFAVKNIKMKISHPRFLIPGSLEDLNLELPLCRHATISSESKGISADVMEKSSSLLFSFPNDAVIHGGATFVWPLWFHAGISENISIFLSIYYEMEGFSSDMIYRTLRMHYDVEVFSSLEVSLLINPCPSGLQDFLVRMDVLNRTNSEIFSLQQLSCVGSQWEIAPLPMYVSICPSETLPAAQALSCFFKLKDRKESSINETKHTVSGSDVLLSPKESKEELIDISRSPLADFHHREQYHQRKSVEVCRSTVDFILISKVIGNDSNLELGAASKLLSKHVCHCSINNNSPIWWSMHGPQAIIHDFSSSFCEATLHVTVKNCSKAVASVKIITFDGLPDRYRSVDTVLGVESAGCHGGWHDVPSATDKSISAVQGVRSKKSSQSIPPFIWCTSSSMQVKLGPECTTEIPLRICMFSPGTYDLSNYELHWTLQPSEGKVAEKLKSLSSGTRNGHPFYLTAQQSPSTHLS